ncbi:vigilin-like [Mizuhopecten yessoensis]|uniref:K Homology domain-containing protein n=1 Tax=Mizuhopecten yessoensis TaxID=6573 RepID=A0A210QG99_MIZYE|nr:vigilin-like [Mizuhopecten yessoensis]OWF47775.1 hypothetical protein KP79_PYT06216 [Mizuhopecten yessoensis]
MVAFVKACVCRLISYKHQVTHFGVFRNVKCIQNVWLSRGLPSLDLRSCSFTNYGNDQDQLYRMKVATHEDSELQKQIAAAFIGKGGRNIRKFGLDCQIDLIGADIWVSGKDVEGVQKTVDRVTTEVQKIKNSILPIQETVLTDEDEYFHKEICSIIIGKGGSKIGSLIFEIGDVFSLNSCDTGRVVVMGTDTEVVRKASEKIQQEVQRIKNEVLATFSEKVLTDENEVSHRQICRMIVGKKGANIKRLISETGMDFDLEVPFESRTNGYVIVTGADAEVVKRAAEIVQQEIQIIKNGNLATISEKVLTDEVDDNHFKISGLLIGKQGENIRRILSATELNAKLNILAKNEKINHINVLGTDVEMVNRVAEKVQQEIHRIKEQILLPFSGKLLTDEDEEIHNRICGKIMGNRGENLNRIRSETGLNFLFEAYEGHILISGREAEVVNKAVEKVQQEIDRIKDGSFLPFSEKVLTDEDEEIHNRICGKIMGKRGENLNKMRLETGLDFHLQTTHKGHIIISGTNAEVVNRAVEKVKQEIHRIKDESFLPFSEKVLTDADEEIHRRICGKILGKRGENLNRMQLETGLDFHLQTHKGYIIISGTDAEVVNRAVEKIQHMVRRFQN